MQRGLNAEYRINFTNPNAQMYRHTKFSRKVVINFIIALNSSRVLYQCKELELATPNFYSQTHVNDHKKVAAFYKGSFFAGYCD